ncbi:hypothetical protein HJG60_001698 [Phyllostomus discolor]|uniref:Uncharacterized protein n=1 Tax=Phyllostomus discolor TaxID=89673 RepID=A0A834DE28_9CHIR|nr:hypothetical protein HJG60_001698 [Phyllostomus discolor]
MKPVIPGGKGRANVKPLRKKCASQIFQCVPSLELFTKSPSAVGSSLGSGAAYRCPGLRQHYLSGSLCPWDPETGS